MNPGQGRQLLGLLLVAGAVLAVPSLRGASASGGDFRFRAALDGQRLDLSTSSDPVRIDTSRETDLRLEMRNSTDRAVIVRQVQVRGRAFGLTLLSSNVTLFSRQRSILARVPAHGDLTLDVPMDFSTVDDQMTGLLPGSMTLVDAQRDELATQDFTMDVRGEATSLVGIFTIVIGAVTLLSIAAICLAVVRRRLYGNRWERAFRFGLTAVGVGVTLTLLLAQLRLVAPTGSVWIPMVLVPVVAAAAIGYISPGPLAIEEEEETEDWMRRATVVRPS